MLLLLLLISIFIADILKFPVTKLKTHRKKNIQTKNPFKIEIIFKPSCQRRNFTMNCNVDKFSFYRLKRETSTAIGIASGNPTAVK